MTTFNLEDRRILEFHKETNGDIRKTAKRARVTEAAIRMRLSRCRRKREELFEDLGFIRKYKVVLEPKKKQYNSEEPKES